jgi:hypothetical protein
MKSHARLLVDIRKCGFRAQGEQRPNHEMSRDFPSLRGEQNKPWWRLNQEMSREVAGRHPKM